MTLEQSFNGHGMIVPRSWNNLRTYMHRGLQPSKTVWGGWLDDLNDRWCFHSFSGLSPVNIRRKMPNPVPSFGTNVWYHPKTYRGKVLNPVPCFGINIWYHPKTYRGKVLNSVPCFRLSTWYRPKAYIGKVLNSAPCFRLSTWYHPKAYRGKLLNGWWREQGS